MEAHAKAGGERVYRAGVVGLGFIGSEAEERHVNYPGRILYPHGHAGAFARAPRTELVAGADLSRTKLEAFGKRWEVAGLYTDSREMLEKEKLDVIGIATPPSHHRQAVLEAVEAGVKGILCEKPLATNLRDADEMLSACERAGVPIAVNTWRRWEPYYIRAKQMVEAGAIGKLKSIVGFWSGLVLNTGSHGYDIITYFADAEVDWVMGHLDDEPHGVEPGGDSYIVYKNGVRALVSGRSGTAAQFELELLGDAGRIRIGNFDASLWKTVPEGGRRLLAQCPFPQSGFMPGPMLTGVENLVHCMETGEEPSSSGRMARLALAVGLATYESSRRGNVKISFPYDNTEIDVPCFEKPVAG